MITNFLDYPKVLGRDADHIAKFFKDELTANNSMNKDGQLIILNKLKELQCENLMKKYVIMYCVCKQCKCIQTDLIKENKVTFIVCKKCQAKTSLGKN